MTMRRLTTMAMTGRRMKRSVNFMVPLPSAVGRRGGQLSLLSVVLHHHRHSISKLEGAVAHQRLALLESGDDCHEVPASLSHADESLSRNQPSLVVLVRLQDVDRVAEGRKEDAGRRNDERLLELVRKNIDACIHPRQEGAALVLDGRSHPDVPGAGVDLRIDGGDGAIPLSAWKDVDLEGDVLPQLDLCQCLLRKLKLCVD